jgi:putative transposase
VQTARPLLPAAQAPDEQWSMDFISDSLASGQRFRILTFVDTMSCERPAMEVDRSLTGEQVVAVLQRGGGAAGPSARHPS